MRSPICLFHVVAFEHDGLQKPKYTIRNTMVTGQIEFDENIRAIGLMSGFGCLASSLDFNPNRL